MKWKYDENLGFVCYDVGKIEEIVRDRSGRGYTVFDSIRVAGGYHICIDTKPVIVATMGWCDLWYYKKGNHGEYLEENGYPIPVDIPDIENRYHFPYKCTDPRILYYHAKACYLCCFPLHYKKSPKKREADMKALFASRPTKKEAIKGLKEMNFSTIPSQEKEYLGAHADAWYNDFEARCFFYLGDYDRVLECIEASERYMEKALMDYPEYQGQPSVFRKIEPFLYRMRKQQAEMVKKIQSKKCRAKQNEIY
ncbi:MAG: hypothetical protein Q4C70_12025 [Planctomycetia bacterium]|nr:hypothetical protein [Planctomycetia bacterium]